MPYIIKHKITSYKTIENVYLKEWFKQDLNGTWIECMDNAKRFNREQANDIALCLGGQARVIKVKVVKKSENK